jgi:hypothetical protein
MLVGQENDTTVFFWFVLDSRISLVGYGTGVGKAQKEHGGFWVGSQTSRASTEKELHHQTYISRKPHIT